MLYITKYKKIIDMVQLFPAITSNFSFSFLPSEGSQELQEE